MSRFIGPTSKRTIVTNYIDEVDLDNDAIYRGALVIDLVKRNRQEDAAIMQIREYLHNITALLDRATDYTVGVGAGEKLRIYLIRKSVHDKLIGSLHTLVKALGDIEHIGIVIHFRSGLSLRQFSDLIEEFATLAGKIEQAKNDGTEESEKEIRERGTVLIGWIEKHGLEEIQNLIFDLSVGVDRGGGTKKPELQALYRLTYGRVQTYQGRSDIWRKITSELWRELEASYLSGGLSDDQRLVYMEWKKLKIYKKRKQQLINLWKPGRYAVNQGSL